MPDCSATATGPTAAPLPLAAAPSNGYRTLLRSRTFVLLFVGLSASDATAHSRAELGASVSFSFRAVDDSEELRTPSGGTAFVKSIQDLSSGEAEGRVVCDDDDHQGPHHSEHGAEVAGGKRDRLGATVRHTAQLADQPCHRAEDTAPDGDISYDCEPKGDRVHLISARAG